jgi:3'(2'), 5'-bisphosphate nucleotidase
MELTTVNLLSAVSDIAQQAGEKILEIYRDESRFERVDFKADDSPLTLADREAHEYIAAKLQETTPEIPILSEEGRNIPFDERKNWKKFWLVDPLDGTKEFIKRNGEFTVNIALVEDGRVSLGVVHVPVKNTTYFAAKGQGAFVIREGEAAHRIQANDFKMDEGGLRLVCSRSHMSKEVEEYLEGFRDPQTVSMGSSLKFMLIAEGRADIYPRLAPTMEWDTGAAQIVVEEAGGRVINHETNQPLRYNKEVLVNPHFIAFGKTN